MSDYSASKTLSSLLRAVLRVHCSLHLLVTVLCVNTIITFMLSSAPYLIQFTPYFFADIWCMHILFMFNIIMVDCTFKTCAI